MIGNILRYLGFKKTFIHHDDEEAEQIRIDFKDRYHNFKLLLNANNKALEIMGDIEQALQGDEPFGMAFIRSNVTAVSVNVFKLIKYLCELSPDKYEELFDRFESIQNEISGLIEHKKTISDPNFVLPLEQIYKESADSTGSKMANLGELKNRIGLEVPAGFAVTSSAYYRFLSHNDIQAEINRRFIAADLFNMEDLYKLSSDIQLMIIRGEIPDDLKHDMMNLWKIMEREKGNNLKVAMRSSALGEDGIKSSFAGQYRSELNVSPDHFFHSYKEVVASKYSLQAMSYRLNRGFRDEDIAMCVGCIEMIDAAAGGVIYSRNPLNHMDDTIFINSSWGLPKVIVDGGGNCDTIKISRGESLKITGRDIKTKETKYICLNEEGISKIDTSETERNSQSISDETALMLADKAIKIEEYYGVPQDIEWAIDTNGKVYFLQCRPVIQIENEIPESCELSPELGEKIIEQGGITASPGTACGVVHIVSKGLDVLEFPEGAVLVTQQALPRWASILNRASAVITEQGNFAGHLASVAREFRIPAIFGIAGITEKLKSGETVTVDAISHTVYCGRIEELLARKKTSRHIMDGSPVFETLQKISRHIIPLNLVDPDSTEFKPYSCLTYHDITRFAHEKSVIEMFDFGRKRKFPERSSKQLHYKVPMQWWILNLDDGFKEEVRNKYVKIENIASVPMLALWEGIIAVVWDGPPPIDGKGLASIMFQATTNTALNVGTKSKYSERNYFMISKNFCSLSTRLGFHFSTLEALVGERRIENYISFRFKGGAADFERRVLRVKFIGEILEEYGFRIESREDSMSARIEGYDQEVMKDKLRILGYLNIHTRQLDMIMTIPARVNYYKKKMFKDINEKVLKNADVPDREQ
ncbi:PEP/pyruvate-binding domain-containing protein [Desulforegula conservatrix]|uniref:PEP/pyruvate-binding domain-containing protein n=1 Tax=Desulforegula conservatrix TaxID=153026 RepID=UPI0003F9452A|nr:PEP/pyruvate-binding domain-containing protein [Desulforegula conservatrix]